MVDEGMREKEKMEEGKEKEGISLSRILYDFITFHAK